MAGEQADGARRRLRLELELEIDGDALAGALVDPADRRAERFEGWVGLTRAIELLIADDRRGEAAAPRPGDPA